MKPVYKKVILLIIAAINITFFVDGAYRLAGRNPIISINGLPDYANIIVGVVEIVITAIILISIIFMKK